MELDEEEHVGSVGGGGGGEGVEGGGDGAGGGDLHRAHGAWEAGGCPECTLALLHPWANPIQRDNRENDKKKTGKKAQVETISSRFFVFGLCGSAGTSSHAND